MGRPLLYGSTTEFLDYFGLKDLAELPRPEELRALVAAREPEQLDMIELQVTADLAQPLPEGAGRTALEAQAASDAEGEPIVAPDDVAPEAEAEPAEQERS